MSLNADILIDRLHLKGQIAKWRRIAILAIFLPVLLIGRFAFSHIPYHPYIARVAIEGVIMDDLQRDALFKDLASDKDVKAVILRVDSPGGTVVGGEQLYQDVKELAKSKPVVVTMRSLAASAGYMITLGASRVYAEQSTMTGSIGVIMQTADLTELASKMGIQPITFKSGPNKAAPNPFEKMTPENQQVIQEAIEDSYHMFVDMVAEGRELPKERVLELADGRIYTGRQAVKLGLIDAIGGEGEAMDWLSTTQNLNKNLEIVDREPEYPEEDKLGSVFGSMIHSWLPFEQKGLQGFVSIWKQPAF